MQVLQKFCSARDREVSVAITDVPLHDAQAPIHDAVAVCLEIGEPCERSICPLLTLPVESLRFRLARDGFDTSMLRHLSGPCPACDRTTDLVALDQVHVYCTECSAVSHWRSVPDDAPTFEG
jgi:hypothetical protein